MYFITCFLSKRVHLSNGSTVRAAIQLFKPPQRGPEWSKMGQNLQQLPMDVLLSSWCLKWGFGGQGIQCTKFLPSSLWRGLRCNPPPPLCGFLLATTHTHMECQVSKQGNKGVWSPFLKKFLEKLKNADFFFKCQILRLYQAQQPQK